MHGWICKQNWKYDLSRWDLKDRSQALQADILDAPCILFGQIIILIDIQTTPSLPFNEFFNRFYGNGPPPNNYDGIRETKRLQYSLWSYSFSF